MSGFAGGKGGGEDDMGDISAQLAALSKGMNLPADGDEDKISQADVDRVVQEAMAAARAGGAKKGRKSKASASKDGDADDDQDDADDGVDLVAGNECLQAGIKAVRAAVVRDNRGELGVAARQYDAAIDQFAQALEHGAPPSADAKTKLLDSMVGYMDRLQDILVNFEPQSDPKSLPSSDTCVPYTELSQNRVRNLQAMAKQGFGCAARGLGLRKRAKAAQEAAETWPAFVLYSEAIDCLVAFMKNDPTHASVKAVEKTIMEMLDSAEAMKKAL